MPLNIAELKRVFIKFDSAAGLADEAGDSDECVNLYAFLSQRKLEIAGFESQIAEIEQVAFLRVVANVPDEGSAPEDDESLSEEEIEKRNIEAASINALRDQIKVAESAASDRLFEEAKTLETLDPESEDVQNLKLLIENKWFARKWGEEEVAALAAERGDAMGATASKIIPAEKYIGDSGNYRGVSEETVLETVKTNFPLFQSVRGDGLCGLHSGIIASLTKCVGDRYYFDAFKSKLNLWSQNIRAEDKQKVLSIIEKLPEELTYQGLHELTSAYGDQNISRVLANSLYANFDFLNYYGTAFDDLSEELQEDIKAYELFHAEKKNPQTISANSVAAILRQISPFDVNVLSAEMAARAEPKEGEIYMIGNGGHFDILHSRLDYNLLITATEIELAAHEISGNAERRTESKNKLDLLKEARDQSQNIDSLERKLEQIKDKIDHNLLFEEILGIIKQKNRENLPLEAEHFRGGLYDTPLDTGQKYDFAVSLDKALKAFERAHYNAPPKQILQMGAELRNKSALLPESYDLFDDSDVLATEFPKFNDASVSIYAPEWVEGTLGKLSDKIKAAHPEGINITFAETAQNPEHTIKLGYPLTLQSLQMLARNKQVNTTGVIDGASYGALDLESIKALKDLVRQVVIIGKDKATGFGGSGVGRYGFDEDASDYQNFENEEGGEPNTKDVYVIDLPGIQFQQRYDTGRLFSHPKEATQEELQVIGVDEIAGEIFKNVTGKDWTRKTAEEMADNPDYLDFGNWCLDKEAYQAFVKEDFVFAANSLAAKLEEANEKRPVSFKFLKNVLGDLADNPELTKQFVIGALQGANEFLDQRASDEASPLRKIQAIELPFCEIDHNYAEESDKDSIKIMDLYNEVIGKIKAQEMQFFSDSVDALSPLTIDTEDGKKSVEFVTATTNCASPHVVMGNEMVHDQSVDAMIAKNLVRKGRTFSPYLNGQMQQKYLGLEKSSFRAAPPTPDIKLSEDQVKYNGFKEKLIKLFEDAKINVKDGALQYTTKQGNTVTYNINSNDTLEVKNPKYGLITKKVGDAKPVELSLKDLEKELTVLAKVIVAKTPANPAPKPKAKESSPQFSNEEIRGEFDKYSKEESEKEVSERQIAEGLRTKVKAIAKSGTEFLVKEGGDGQAISAKEAAKDKLRDFADKHVAYKEGTNKSDFLDNLAEYSAIGVAVKAVKASFNDKVEKKVGKTEIDQEAFGITKDHQRHMRISFKGVDFSESFLNSFANCEFDGGCNFTKISDNQNKFVNCTFGKECTPQQAKELAKLGPDNLYGCKFSPEFITKLGGEAAQQKFKDALKIGGDVVDGFYKNPDKKPDSQFAPISAFKIKEVQQARVH